MSDIGLGVHGRPREGADDIPPLAEQQPRLSYLTLYPFDARVWREFGTEWNILKMLCTTQFVLLKQGKEVDRVLGPKKDELEKKVDRLLVLRRLTGRWC
ncbi:hypothetical protein RHSIM_Rhsim04G0171500 [Rhododendron simsii]|uniref:Uncharacterized protein n=1 Tax=Rhododendron simsii TaxID=118357 RepID=A0A834HBL8_RHOSS|nr:hypothetical protein RHSIM_Rhsim04G0171500 [Rhododendron simsii]